MCGYEYLIRYHVGKDTGTEVATHIGVGSGTYNFLKRVYKDEYYSTILIIIPKYAFMHVLEVSFQ